MVAQSLGVVMKTEYLVFAVLLTPTLVVALAAVISLATPEPTSAPQAPIVTAASAGVYPAELTTDE